MDISAPHANNTTPYTDAELKRVFKKTANFVAWKYANLSAVAVEDIAVEAISYALQPGLRGDGPFPRTSHDLLAVSLQIAKWRALDANRKCRRAVVAEYLDNPVSVEGRDVCGEKHPIAERHAFQRYREARRAKDWRATGRRAMGRLSTFLAGRGVSPRDRAVFHDYFILGNSADEVSKRHQISVGNVFTIACRVKSLVKADGRELVRE